MLDLMPYAEIVHRKAISMNLTLHLVTTIT